MALNRTNSGQKNPVSRRPRGRVLFDRIEKSTGDSVKVPGEWKKFSTRFDATCRSAMNFAEGKASESEFRDWIEFTPAVDFWNDEPLPDIPVSIGPCQFDTVRDFVVIGNAAVLAARDSTDRDTLLRRVGRLFDQADWLESAQPSAGVDDFDRIREDTEALIDRWGDGGRGIFPPGDPIDGPVGNPDGGPDDGPGRFGRPPLDDCAFRRRLCMRDIIDLLGDLGDYRDSARPTSRMAFADNITTITQQGCVGDELVIEGFDFGDTQPSNIRLSMPSESGCQNVDIEPANWTDTHISFTVPEWARGGCVGFFDDDAIAQWNSYWDGYEDRVNDINSIAIECRPFGAGMPVVSWIPRHIPTCPPCDEANRFFGGVPVIERFRVNGQDELRAQPDGIIRLNWAVENADKIEVSLSSAYGEPFNDSDDMVGRGRVSRSETIDMNLNADGDAVYTVAAENACGTVEAQVIVHVRRNTVPAVHGIEAVQVVQTFVSDNSPASNTVPIIEGKRTLVRIYVSSGLPATYNTNGRLQNVSARARVRGLSSGGSLGTFVNADVGYGGSPPVGGIVRGAITDTLNVEVPFDEIQGRFRIEIEVFSTDTWSRWRRLTDTLEIQAYPSPTLDIVPIDIIDNFRANAGPTAAERRLGMRDIQSTFPLGESNLRRFTTGNPTITTNRNYDVNDNWRNNSLSQDSLMDDLEEVAEEFADNGEVWCATVPQAARSAGSPGIIGTARTGTIFRYRKASWITATPRNAGNMATAQRVSPHEIGHILGLGHSTGTIAEFGVEVRTRTVFPTATVNLMNAAAGPWVSIGEYVYLLAFMRRDLRPRLIREGWDIARVLDLSGRGL